jgi:hypothetical protein
MLRAMKKFATFLLKSALALIVIGGVSFGYWLLTKKFQGETLVEISTGKEESFEVEEAQSVKFFDTNTGLGSSPGKIDPEKGVYLYQPNGELCELDTADTGGSSFYFGQFHLPVAGTYRFVLEDLPKVGSRGALIAHDKLPFRSKSISIALTCLGFAGPMAFLGGLLWMISPCKPVAKEPIPS